MTSSNFKTMLNDFGKTIGDIDVGPVAKAGFKGFAVGAGTAATLALVRQMAEANRQKRRDKERRSTEIGPNTIVLRVNKRAEACGECGSSACEGHPDGEPVKPASPSIRVEPAVETREVRPTASVQPRDEAGRFSSVSQNFDTEKVAFDTIADEAKGILAVGGGAVAGYYIISRLAEKMEQNRLRKQIAAAQTEYIDLLDGRNVKGAEAFTAIFGDCGLVDGIEKDAGVFTNIYNAAKGTAQASKHGLAGLLALYVLAAGGTAYVTNRLLEDRFGKKDEEDLPSKPTRILVKASSADDDYMEISPEHMLATIGIMRDCIADSLPPGVKVADGYDYSFLDDIANMEGGRQWLLDNYAKQQGMDRPDMEDFKLPVSMLARHGATLADLQANPDKHSAAIRSHVMDMMKKDPRGWFDLLGGKRNFDIVRAKADEQIANMQNQGGFMGFLAKIPYLGDAVKRFSKWYTTNSKWGRRMMARKTLEQMGVKGDEARGILDSYDYTGNGWAAKPQQSPSQQIAAAPAQPAPQPAAQPVSPAPVAAATAQPVKAAQFIPSSVMGFLSRTKTLTDAKNKDILKALARIEELEKSKRSGKKGEEPGSGDVVVEFDDDIGSVLSDEDKRKIVEGLTR